MTPQYMLQAALTAMLRGNKAPHCFRSWVEGKGYSNDGSLVETRADYLLQLQRKATGEIDNLGFSPAYAEPTADQPPKGILFADWNCFPLRLHEILARAGYALEWYDEWTTCDDCNKTVRTQPDSWDWTPAYTELDGELLCSACSPSVREVLGY